MTHYDESWWRGLSTTLALTTGAALVREGKLLLALTMFACAAYWLVKQARS
jgi:hypothetical protein